MMQSHSRQMKTMIANALLVISLSSFGDSSYFANESPTTIMDMGDTFTQQSGFGNVTCKSTNASNLPPLSPLGPFDRYIDQLPLFGYPGPLFYAVHSLGLISLSVSVLVGIILIFYLFFWSRQNSRFEEAPRTVSTEHHYRRAFVQFTPSNWSWINQEIEYHRSSDHLPCRDRPGYGESHTYWITPT